MFAGLESEPEEDIKPKPKVPSPKKQPVKPPQNRNENLSDDKKDIATLPRKRPVKPIKYLSDDSDYDDSKSKVPYKSKAYKSKVEPMKSPKNLSEKSKSALTNNKSTPKISEKKTPTTSK